MTTSAIGTHSHGTHSHGTHSRTTTIAHSTAAHRPAAGRPAVDVLVERLAVSLLAWSSNRAQKSRLTHERMGRILETQRNLARGGSSLGR